MATPQFEGRPVVADGPAAARKSAGKPLPVGRPAFWLPLGTLWSRELVIFFRQRGRLAGAVGTPLLFWLLIGLGFGKSFRAAAPRAPAGMGYLEYFFPGTILLVVLFSSIFSTMSVIEDRNEGFLLSVLVAPISRAALVLGKILGGSTLALAQGLVFVVLAPLIGIRLGLGQAIGVTAVLFLISFALTALGFYFAWRLDSVQGFHSVMSLVLLPMWLLSGALFPVSGAHFWIRLLMRVNPLTYGMAALRNALYGTREPGAPPMVLSVGVMAGFGILALAAGWWEVKRPSSRGAA
ncbi:MAG: ABC transporter permease [Acidobacteria bacterium]|nr:ABC transporter permease [Acidobacteriota bacterium]